MSARDVTLAQQGDPAAFTRLVEAWATTVTSVATAITRSPTEGEDVAQDVFVAAWGQLDRLQNPDSFGPWIRQMARNKARDRVRWQARRRSGEPVETLVDPSPSADEALSLAEEEHAVWEALSELRPDDREVLVLYHSEARSTAQVAALLDLTEASVRKRLSRARARLRVEVLERLGSAASRSAPGAAFVAGVGAAIAASAPTTAHAATGALVGKGLAAVVGGALAGMTGGLLGVWLGVRFAGKTLPASSRPTLRRLAWAQSAAVVWAGTSFLWMPPRAVLAFGMVPLLALLTASCLVLARHAGPGRGRAAGLLGLSGGVLLGGGGAVLGMADQVPIVESLGVLALSAGFFAAPVVALATLPAAVGVRGRFALLGMLSWVAALPLLLGGPIAASALGASPLMVGITLSLCAGVGEETTRAVLFAVVRRRGHDHPALPVVLGLGHGALEALLFGLPAVLGAVFLPADGPAWAGISFGLARMAIVFVHVGLSVAVWQARRHPLALVAAIAAHILLDLGALVAPQALPGGVGLGIGAASLVLAVVGAAVLVRRQLTQAT